MTKSNWVRGVMVIVGLWAPCLARGNMDTCRTPGAYPVFDLDANQTQDGLSDGMGWIVGMFGFTGEIVNQHLDPNGNRDRPDAYLNLIRTLALDIDGNGKVDALTDGILLFHYMLGFRGDLLAQYTAPGAPRSSARALEAHLGFWAALKLRCR